MYHAFGRMIHVGKELAQIWLKRINVLKLMVRNAFLLANIAELRNALI